MRITATTTLVGPTTKDGDWECYEYAVRLRHTSGRTMRTRFYVGLGWTEKPSASDILESLLSDASSVQYEGVDGWIAEYGYEVNSTADVRKYERLYHQIERQTERLKRFLGDDYPDALSDPEGYATRYASRQRAHA